MTAVKAPRVVLLPLPTVAPDCLCGDPKHDGLCPKAGCGCRDHREALACGGCRAVPAGAVRLTPVGSRLVCPACLPVPTYRPNTNGGQR